MFTIQSCAYDSTLMTGLNVFTPGAVVRGSGNISRTANRHIINGASVALNGWGGATVSEIEAAEAPKRLRGS